LIANAFYLAGLIERWGSGTKRIVDLCIAQQLPEPEYKEEQGGFSVWFYKDIYTEEDLKKMGLNERQIKVMLYAKGKVTITNKEIREMVGVSDRTVIRDLNKLCELGMLKKSEEPGEERCTH